MVPLAADELSPGGYHVHRSGMTLKETNRDALEAVIGLHREGGSQNVEVRDNSVGISQADLPYICRRFHRFVRYENDGVKDTVLVLSILPRAVEAP